MNLIAIKLHSKTYLMLPTFQLEYLKNLFKLFTPEAATFLLAVPNMLQLSTERNHSHYLDQLTNDFSDSDTIYRLQIIHMSNSKIT